MATSSAPGQGGEVDPDGHGSVDSTNVGQDRTCDPPSAIEVERKFCLNEGSEEKLLALGGKLVKESQFTDVYYDTDDYTLTLSDHWLRRRDHTWQLKCPPPPAPVGAEGDDTVEGNAPRNEQKSTQYMEHETEGAILKALTSVLGEDSSTTGCSNLQQLLQVAGLNEFAQYTTHRKTYALDGFTIDLDLTDFGFRVGEIEVLVVDESHISEALHQIDELAEKLGRYYCNRVVERTGPVAPQNKS